MTGAVAHGEGAQAQRQLQGLARGLGRGRVGQPGVHGEGAVQQLGVAVELPQAVGPFAQSGTARQRRQGRQGERPQEPAAIHARATSTKQS
jgi:hypothetical protein